MGARDPARLTAARLAPALLVVVALFGGAIAGAVRTSVSPLAGGVSLDAWRELLEDPAFSESLLFTARVAFLSTLVSVLLAVVLAGALRRRGTLIRALATMPVPVPHLLAAAVAVLWLAPGGLAERIVGELPVELIRDRQGLGIVLVYVYKETPFLMLLLLAAMGRSLSEREEAAAMLGAGPWQRLRWVIWPTIRGPLMVGTIVVLAFVVGAFEVPLAVGPNQPTMLAAYAFEATPGDVIAGEQVAAATLVLTTVIAVALAAVAVRFARTAEGA